MNDVMESFKIREAKKKIPVLRMEIDYELLTLHEAICARNQKLIHSTKVKLKKLTNELLQLQKL